MLEFLALVALPMDMDPQIPPQYSRPHWDRPLHFHPMRATPVDPRWGLNRWQRFKYAIKILAGRESFEERLARLYYD